MTTRPGGGTASPGRRLGAVSRGYDDSTRVPGGRAGFSVSVRRPLVHAVRSRTGTRINGPGLAGSCRRQAARRGTPGRVPAGRSAGLSKIRARLGGRIRFLLSGSATRSADVAIWFAAAGMPVIEGYALTETGGGACISSIEGSVSGIVGLPLVGSEVKIADDGEILLRGPLVRRGYHNQPDATAEGLSAPRAPVAERGRSDCRWCAPAGVRGVPCYRRTVCRLER
ncbi:MAG: AMP-binding protein [Blastococcus sp.]